MILSTKKIARRIFIYFYFEAIDFQVIYCYL